MLKIAGAIVLFTVVCSLTSGLLAQLSPWTGDFYSASFPAGLSGFALLLIRVLFGVLFILHGYPKVRHLKQWAEFVKLPVFLCFIAAWSMFLGGFFLIAGFLTPLVALVLLGAMAFALIQEMLRGHAFVAKDPYLLPEGRYEGPEGHTEPPSFEKATIYCAVMIVIIVLGPGAFSVDALLIT